MRNERKRVSNKIVTGIMTFMLMVSVFGVCDLVSAKAAPNTGDTSWSFNVSTSNTSWQFTGVREKRDDSKIYVHWQNGYNGVSSIYITPYGYSTSKGSGACGTDGGHEVSYKLNSTGKYSVTNYVNERGYTHAKIGIKSAVGNGTAKGVWSPDSAGTYTVLY